MMSMLLENETHLHQSLSFSKYFYVNYLIFTTQKVGGWLEAQCGHVKWTYQWMVFGDKVFLVLPQYIKAPTPCPPYLNAYFKKDF